MNYEVYKILEKIAAVLRMIDDCYMEDADNDLQMSIALLQDLAKEALEKVTI